jgi:very-short-patch-repair endonuclease
MLSETDLNLVIILPNIGKITVKNAIDKGLLELPHYNTRGKTFEEIHGVERAEEIRENMSKASTGRKKTPEHCLSISKAFTGRKLTTKHKLNISKAMIGKNTEKKSPEHIEKLTKNLIERWKNPEFAKMMWEALAKKPNKLEKEFNKLLQIICPGDFKYVGNGGLIIDGKCPDWRHVTKPKLIEVFGDHWHKREEEQERIDFFKKHEYNTLIIWESEFWDEREEVAKKILMFINE